MQDATNKHEKSWEIHVSSRVDPVVGWVAPVEPFFALPTMVPAGVLKGLQTLHMVAERDGTVIRGLAD